MRKVCAWCNRELSSTDDARSNDITHGICMECSERVFRTPHPRTVQDFINTLSSPIVIIENIDDIVLANDQARKILKVKVGNKIGDAADCPNAKLQGGCGKTVHCKACAVRKVIQQTMQTGKNHNNIEAYQDTSTPAGTKHHTLKLATERIGNTILVRIDELKEEILDTHTEITHSPWITDICLQCTNSLRMILLGASTQSIY